jgi:hypothetical protein
MKLKNLMHLELMYNDQITNIGISNLINLIYLKL